MVKEKQEQQHYVINKEFLAALVDYKKDCKEAKKKKLPQPRVPEFLGECIIKIANGLSYRPNFAKYTYSDEMVGYAIVNGLQAIHKFNPSKSKNPFGYFTTIIWYAFLRKMEEEERNFYTRCKEYENCLPDLVGNVNISDEYHLFLMQTIADYEEKKDKRKIKQRERLKKTKVCP